MGKVSMWHFYSLFLAFQIDRLIQSHFPKHFDQVLIEKEAKYNFNNKNGSNKKVIGNYLQTLFLAILLIVPVTGTI